MPLTGSRRDLERHLIKLPTQSLGGIDSFTTMWKKLNLEDTAMSVKDTLLDWLHKVEKAVDKASNGPIHLANTKDGKLCPCRHWE